ncbi:TonB-dependent siderophore receptor [Pseudomonas sp. 5P_5.1_Bac1]|uniref:TonB-dependent siderophore receptor n=1 Tax=Pseudomonas sp. 5P_5.1_Bac1 TaxID=2971616 RepID=UPI0021C886D4|nr:TonB-dependent siderophore receptor [Pseudomonas sp. 5P_5.1_Bac1]MCU1723256.1 TonB-dependent siderophore receptor [Pseudomonas sp. 5P_5.1_Bac1]
MRVKHRPQTALALAIHLALGGVLALPAVALAEQAGSVQTRAYDIAPGPLTEALSRFASVSGVVLSFDGASTQGRRSPGLRGEHSIASGFASLLAGSGLQAVRQSSGVYLLVAGGRGDGSIELGATSITGQALGTTTENTGSYTTGAVTIGKSEHKLKDIPQTVSVMTRQRMDDQNITNLPDLFANAPGMVFSKSPGTGGFISSRGFEIEAMQYDGVPLTRGVYALGSYLNESTAFYDRVEIIRGGAALLQGANSPGGAVNFVRKRGQAKPTVTLTGQAGSWDHYASQVDVGGPLNEAGTVRGRAVVDYDTSGSFIDYVNSWDQKVYAALDVDLSEDTTFGIGVSNRTSHFRPMVAGLPRYRDGGDIELSRSTYTGSDWNRGMIEQSALYADLEHRFNDHWRLKAAVTAINEHNKMTYAYTVAFQDGQGGVLPDGSALSNWQYATDFESQNRGADIFVSGDYNGLGFDQEVVLGANYSRLTSDDTMARVISAGANIFNLDNHLPWQDYDSLAAAGTRTDSNYEIVQKGIYGTWRVKLADPLTLVLGGRTSWYSYDYSAKIYNRNVFSYDTSSPKANNGVVTPYAGLIYALNPEWSAYASYADVFIPQSALGMGGSTLEPITGSNYELGLKGELLEGRLNTAIALFRYDNENRAVTIPNTTGQCNGSSCSEASGKVRSQGLEAEISGEVLAGLQASASYTYNTTKFLEDATYQDKVFSTWTPKHTVRLWADYTLPDAYKQFSVGGGVNTQSSTISNDRKFDQPGFSVWSARLGYKVNDEIALALNLNNLFDKVYYLPAYSQLNANNYYGDPRNFMVTVKYTPQF